MANETSTPTNGKANGSVNALRRYVLPVALSLIGAYVGVTFTLGQWQQRIVDLEKQNVELKAEIARTNKRIDDEHGYYVPYQTYKDNNEALIRLMDGLRGDINGWKRGR